MAETGQDHQHSESVVLAAQWLADQYDPRRPVVPELKQRFGLSAVEATEACGLAQSMRVLRRAHG